MRYYIRALQNYANFSGRASRKEFWMFQLFFFLIYTATVVMDVLLGTAFENGRGPFMGLFSSATYLAHLLPAISLLVRRLHDIDKSGWYLLLFLIPVVGPILLLIWTLTPGTPGENRFGPPPQD
ncbi:MAG: DUF805 domain-containing protein [Thermotogae bacterium]|nr:DUF805 domain-containing protein [Thermotogota bacterium]